MLLRYLLAAALAVAFVPGLVLTPAAAAQGASVTDADIQRLSLAISDAEAEVQRAVDRKPDLASRYNKELADLRDEAAYLRVKLRKERSVSREEYYDLRDRIDDLRARARAEVNGPAASSTSASSSRTTSRSAIPVGTELDVRLQDPLSSGRNQVEDRFIATTAVDLQVGDRVVIPAGSEMRGVVSGVDKAGRLDRKGSLTLAFDQITVNGRDYPMRATVVQALESEGVRGEVGRIGTGAGAGAIIGGILGGVKGALAGILIGGGGVIAATPGKDVELEPGTILRIRLDTPPEVR
ncbi:MAG TPA: hypothetical protein VF198_12855 [Vicinamibacterales bacterium]